MINYQLPSGKTIRITIEAFLNMSDEDIKYLSHNNYGSSSENPFDDESLSETDTITYAEDSTDEIIDIDENDLLLD